jgi:hypothetical protein
MRLCFFVIALAITSTAQDKFTPNGDPFNNFRTPTAFDSACPAQTGDAADGTGSFAQDKVKNNLEAHLPPEEITIETLAALQQDIATHKGFPWGRGKEPKTRDTFHKMKGDFQEGDAVQLTAYILEAHTADTESGESVNCGFGTTEGKAQKVVSTEQAIQFNDIHIALVTTASLVSKGKAAGCQSVTAEISPHFRPAAWTADLFQKGLLVRLTGQLMYDASHTVCHNGIGKGGQPSRESGWEVHPVYQVEICTKDDGDGNCTGEFVTAEKFKPTHAASPHKKSTQKKSTTKKKP